MINLKSDKINYLLREESKMQSSFDYDFDYDTVIKAIVWGADSVGKTAFILRATKNQYYEYSRYMHEDFRTILFSKEKSNEIKSHPDKIVKLVLWDNFKGTQPEDIDVSDYRGAHLHYILYDVTNPRSLVRAQELCQKLSSTQSRIYDNAMLVLVGTKMDLIPGRQIDPREVKEFADEHKISFFEISAKTRENVADLLNASLSAVITKRLPPAPMAKNEQKIKDPNAKNIELKTEKNNQYLRDLTQEVVSAIGTLPRVEEEKRFAFSSHLTAAYKILSKVTEAQLKLSKTKPSYFDDNLYKALSIKLTELRTICIAHSDRLVSDRSDRLVSDKQLPLDCYYDYILMTAEKNDQEIQSLITKIQAAEDAKDPKLSFAKKLPELKKLKILHRNHMYLLKTFPHSRVPFFSSDKEKNALARLTAQNTSEKEILLFFIQHIKNHKTYFDTMLAEQESSVQRFVQSNQDAKKEKEALAKLLKKLPNDIVFLKNYLEFLGPPFILQDQEMIYGLVKEIEGASTVFRKNLPKSILTHSVDFKRMLAEHECSAQRLMQSNEDPKKTNDELVKLSQQINHDIVILNSYLEFLEQEQPLDLDSQQITYRSVKEVKEVVKEIVNANKVFLERIYQSILILTSDLVFKEEDELLAEQELPDAQNPEKKETSISKAKERKASLTQMAIQLNQIKSEDKKNIKMVSGQHSRITQLLSSLEITMSERKKQNLVAFNEEKEAKNFGIDEYPNSFKCAMTQEVMLDPYILPSKDPKGVSYSYEKQAILKFTANTDSKNAEIDPLNKQALLGSPEKIMVPDFDLRRKIQEFYSKNTQLLPQFISTHLDKPFDVVFDWINTLKIDLSLKENLFKQYIENAHPDAIGPRLISKKINAIKESVNRQKMSIAEAQLTLSTIKTLLEKRYVIGNDRIKRLIDRITEFQNYFAELALIIAPMCLPEQEKKLPPISDEKLISNYLKALLNPEDDDEDEDPREFRCPYTEELMMDPVYLDEKSFPDKTRYEAKVFIEAIQKSGMNIYNMPIFGLNKETNKVILPTPEEINKIYTSILRRDDALREKIEKYKKKKEEARMEARKKLPALRLMETLTQYSSKQVIAEKQPVYLEFKKDISSLQEVLLQGSLDELKTQIEQFDKMIHTAPPNWLRVLSSVERNNILHLLAIIQKNDPKEKKADVQIHPVLFNNPESKKNEGKQIEIKRQEEEPRLIPLYKLRDKLQALADQEKDPTTHLPKDPTSSLPRAVTNLTKSLNTDPWERTIETAKIIRTVINDSNGARWAKQMAESTRKEMNTLLDGFFFVKPSIAPKGC
jgi:GTPase SAR1 family protein